MGNGIKSSAELIERLRRKREAHENPEVQKTPNPPEALTGEAEGKGETNQSVEKEALQEMPKDTYKRLNGQGFSSSNTGNVEKEGVSIKKLLNRVNSIHLEDVKDDEDRREEETKQIENKSPTLSVHSQKANGLPKEPMLEFGNSLDNLSNKTEKAVLPKLPQTRQREDTKNTQTPLSTREGNQGSHTHYNQTNTQNQAIKDLTSINQDISALSRVPASLGMDSVKIERDTSYAIAFCNPHIRRLLKHYKDDPFWSAPSREIISLCLLDNTNSFLDPASILSMVGGMSDSERARALKMGLGYNQMTSPADASVAAKTIIFRMKLTRIHHFIREYDSGSKSESEVDQFINNIIYVSKHYGLSMEVENLSRINLDEIFPDDEFYEGGLRVFPSFFSPLNDVLGYGGYLTGQLVTVAGAPARGKTTFLFNEAVNFAIRGRRVLYFALADQDKADLVLKFLAIFYGYRFLRRLEEEKGKEALLEFIQNTYDGLVFAQAYADVGGYHNPLFDLSPSKIHARNPRMFFDDEVNEIISRIDIVVETEVRPHIQDIQATVMSRTQEPDVVIVDYDRSIKARTTEGLYQEGEEIYDGLVALTKPKGGKKKLVIVASQINKGYWHLPDPPLQSLAESSRKQAISDIVITIGKNIEKTGVHEGFISLVKNRRGPTGKFGYFLLPTTNMVPWSSEYIQEERKKIRRRKKEEHQESLENED